MSTTIGLTAEGPYIMKNMVIPTNTVIFPEIPIKQCHSEVRNDSVKMVVKLPLLSDKFTPNEDIITTILNLVAEEKITNVKTVSNDIVLNLDYIVKGLSTGNTIASSVKLTKVNLSNFILLCDSVEGNKLQYRTGRIFKAKAEIDIPQDRSFGIRYNRKTENYAFFIKGLTLTADLIDADNVFDNIVDDEYFNRVMEWEYRRHCLNRKAHDRFIHGHFHGHRHHHEHRCPPPPKPNQYHPYHSEYPYNGHVHNPLCSHKDSYVSKVQYDSDRTAILESALDIFTTNMLQSIYDNPIYIEFSNNLTKVIVDLEVYIDYAELANISDLEELIIANKALEDGIDFSEEPPEQTPINPNKPNDEEDKGDTSTNPDDPNDNHEYGGNNTDNDPLHPSNPDTGEDNTGTEGGDSGDISGENAGESSEGNSDIEKTDDNTENKSEDSGSVYPDVDENNTSDNDNITETEDGQSSDIDGNNNETIESGSNEENHKDSTGTENVDSGNTNPNIGETTTNDTNNEENLNTDNTNVTNTPVDNTEVQTDINS